jgi:hypothetical protein
MDNILSENKYKKKTAEEFEVNKRYEQYQSNILSDQLHYITHALFIKFYPFTSHTGTSVSLTPTSEKTTRITTICGGLPSIENY